MRESLRPIEAGCAVLVIPLDKPVFRATVREKAGFRTPEHPRHDVWWLDHDGSGERAACECALIPLDPDDDQRERFEREARIDRQSEVVHSLARRLREMER